MESIKALMRRPLKFLKSLIPAYHIPVDQQLPPEEREAEEQGNPTSLNSLNLSPRVFNCLLKADIHNIETVASMSDESLLNIPGFGTRALTELKERLASYNSSDEDI